MPGPFRTHVSRITVLTALFGVLVFCASLFLFFEPGSALAQTPFEQLGEASRLPQTDLITIIARLIRVFLSVLGILFVLLILYAGYLYMVSQGDPAKTEKARKIISQAVVGFIIIMASYGITTFVMNLLLKATGRQGIVQAPVERYAEPLGSALGAGIIDNHYPPRNALDIPRNTKIFLTFKEAMDPTTLIQGDGELNANNILIFETSRGKGAKLDSAAVRVVANEDRTVFVFDPVELLGNPTTDVNYTVALQPGLKKANGKNAFVGAYASGYGW
ncbi:hypothetical protein FJZ23_02245, partial [Candidatus Parcubacteria bacterium]|nr:hypothetical protein [Candidatus Parcubacteria bacterium]